MSDQFLVRINHFEKENDKVYYYILIISKANGQITKLRKRYSELKDFHNTLQHKIKEFKLNIYLPLFPGKKLFGKTNNSSQDIVHRQIELQSYLQELLNIKKLLSLKFVQGIIPKRVENQGPVIEQSIQMKQLYTEQNEADACFVQPQSIFEEEKFNGLWQPPQTGGDIRVRIERYTINDDVVHYFVNFFDMKEKEEWVFKSRYSEVRSLNEALQKVIKNTKLPEFPGRKIFGITNENPELIEQRREKLESYLNSLLVEKEVMKTEVMSYFIENSRKSAERNKLLEEIQMKKIKKLKQRLNKNEQQKLMKIMEKTGVNQDTLKQMFKNGNNESSPDGIANISNEAMELGKKPIKVQKFKRKYLPPIAEEDDQELSS